MEKKKIVLIGAGSAMFTQGLLADMILSERPWEIRLCDIDPEALETAHGLCARMLAARPGNVTVKAGTDRRELLPGADVVTTTIAVGGRRAWERDVEVPRKYGIHQPVGDSVLPGGISRTLRHVPLMVDIARDVKELCPEAWFFNYSNPMSAICRAVAQETAVPVIGLCHGVQHVLRFLARFVDLDEKECSGVAVGVNHLTWFLEFYHQGQNSWPRIREELASQKDADLTETGKHLAEAGTAKEKRPQRKDNPFSWDLFETYGAFPAVLDRHVIEFFPALCREKAYYGMTPGSETFSMDAVIKHGDEIYESIYEQARGKKPLDMGWTENRVLGEQEQLIEILSCLWGDNSGVYSVNLPNRGQVANLPEGAVIEGPCLINSRGFSPLTIGELPTGIAGILQGRISSQQLSVDAALSGDRELLVQALIADGAVTRPEIARQLAEDLIAAQADHLPRFTAPFASSAPAV